jgi:hypothetical protein
VDEARAVAATGLAAIEADLAEAAGVPLPE